MGEEPPKPMPRSILLVDCDAFFVQVARLEDPEGAGRTPLLLVGGQGGRGVVTSASYEARAYGIRSGMPMAEALRKCPEARAVPVSRRACRDRSHAIRETLEQLAPKVQAASIDEFYLDLTGTERLRGGEALDRASHRIREAVIRATDIHVSIGGGTNRLIAKLAAGRAKPSSRQANPSSGHTSAPGVWIVPPGGESDFMATLDVQQIPGVGPTLAGHLAERGIRTIPELLQVEEGWLVRWLGRDRALSLRERALGRDDSPVTPWSPAKSISAERTFDEDVPPGAEGDEFLGGALLHLVSQVGRNLRKAGRRARTVHLKLRDGDWTTHGRSHTVKEALESDAALFRIARELLDRLRKRGRPTRLLGLGVSGLVVAFGDHGAIASQLELMLPGLAVAPDDTPGLESERDRRLSALTDELQNRFGDGVIRPGRTLEPDPRKQPHA
jgi:DNA polymerase-4